METLANGPKMITMIASIIKPKASIPPRIYGLNTPIDLRKIPKRRAITKVFRIPPVRSLSRAERMATVPTAASLPGVVSKKAGK